MASGTPNCGSHSAAACMTVLPVACQLIESPVCWCVGDTRFYTAFIALQRLLECRTAVRSSVVTEEWERWADKYADKAATILEIVEDNSFWAAMKLFCKLAKPVVELVRTVDSNMPTMGKVSFDMLASLQVATCGGIMMFTGFTVACRCTPCAWRFRSTSTSWAWTQSCSRRCLAFGWRGGIGSTVRCTQLRICSSLSSGWQSSAGR